MSAVDQEVLTQLHWSQAEAAELMDVMNLDLPEFDINEEG